MKKNIAIALLIFCLTSAIQGASGIIGKGVKLGLNISNIAGWDVSDLWMKKTGIAVGGFLTYGLSDTLAIQPEILFVQKGAVYQDTVGGELRVTRANLGYFEVPILAKFYIPEIKKWKIQPCLFAGPYISLKLSGTLSTEFMGTTETEDIQNSKGTDLGLVFGGGAEIALGRAKLTLDARFTWGGLSILKDVEDKNRTFSVLLGYSFR